MTAIYRTNSPFTLEGEDSVVRRGLGMPAGGGGESLLRTSPRRLSRGSCPGDVHVHHVPKCLLFGTPLPTSKFQAHAKMFDSIKERHVSQSSQFIGTIAVTILIS